jgi:hypothetical protein
MAYIDAENLPIDALMDALSANLSTKRLPIQRGDIAEATCTHKGCKVVLSWNNESGSCIAHRARTRRSPGGKYG